MHPELLAPAIAKSQEVRDAVAAAPLATGILPEDVTAGAAELLAAPAADTVAAELQRRLARALKGWEESTVESHRMEAILRAATADLERRLKAAEAKLSAERVPPTMEGPAAAVTQHKGVRTATLPAATASAAPPANFASAGASPSPPSPPQLAPPSPLSPPSSPVELRSSYVAPSFDAYIAAYNELFVRELMSFVESERSSGAHGATDAAEGASSSGRTMGQFAAAAAEAAAAATEAAADALQMDIVGVGVYDTAAENGRVCAKASDSEQAVADAVAAAIADAVAAAAADGGAAESPAAAAGDDADSAADALAAALLNAAAAAAAEAGGASDASGSSAGDAAGPRLLISGPPDVAETAGASAAAVASADRLDAAAAGAAPRPLRAVHADLLRNGRLSAPPPTLLAYEVKQLYWAGANKPVAPPRQPLVVRSLAEWGARPLCHMEPELLQRSAKYLIPEAAARLAQRRQPL